MTTVLQTLGRVLLGILFGAMASSACSNKEQTALRADVPRRETPKKLLTQSINVLEGFTQERVQSFVKPEIALVDKSRVCAGHASDLPNVHLFVEQHTTLRLNARPLHDEEVDLVMAVQSEQGGVLCSDDVDGLNPAIDTEFEPGAYNIWVGAHDPVGMPDVELIVQDVLRTLPQGVAPKPLEAGAYGGFTLEKETGPGQLKGRGGGTRQATDIGPGCTGFIGMRPDHILVLREESSLRASAHAADADLVLLLQHSSGKVLCNDDADGANPVIRATMDAGTWNVYVGTFAPSKYPEYVFRVSR